MIAVDDRTAANERLTPYVPRLVIDWLRTTPEATSRTLDGTLLFADISGFTRLSEALSRRGKVGAELMRDSLDGVFAALLDDAYDYGAGLIKWGGDALLLLFDGDDHPARAARAAWEMQRTIGRVGRLKAPGGTVVLRMSIGIASGPIEFFLVGGVHRELLVGGPTATETVTMEAIADAGEIALSPAVAAALGRAATGPPKDAAILLAEPPQAIRERAPDVGDVSGIDIAACIPVAARAHVLLDRSEPEHRTITAAFIDLIGIDELLARLGRDALATELDERLRTIQEAALRYEVPFYETDVGKGSIKALLTAGAPSSAGHDEERALLALRDIVETPGRVPLRVGVNTGKVFTGDFGPPYRRAYRVFGDAINTAARVMSRAEPGQILATDVVLERSPTLFAITALEPFAAKGKALPIRASVVGPAAGRRATATRAVFAGRDAELEALLAVVAAARNGERWTVALSGRPGLGRSHLVDELIARSPDVRVLRARCDEYRSATPYFPLHNALRTLLDLTPDTDASEVETALRAAVANRVPDLAPWLPLLAIPFGLELPPTPETARLEERFLRPRLAEAVSEFLSAILGDRPAMLLVEDAHHVDEATIDLLGALDQLAGENQRRAWLVLLTLNDPASGFASPALDDETRSLAFSLLPLPFRRACELIELATDDDPLPPHVVSEVARRSGGNLVFLWELLELVHTTRSLDALPDSVEALVAAEIDRLGPRDRDLLRYASVLGIRFDPALLQAALEGELEFDEAAWSRLGGLIARDPEGGLRFRDALVREAAYEGLPYRRRRALHAWLGEAIEARSADEAETLALHFSEAQNWDKAWVYGRHAAERASAVYANVEAATMWERAIAAARRLRPLDRPQLAAALEALGDVRVLLGEFDRASLAFRAGRRLLDAGSPRAGELVLKESRIPLRLGNYRQSLRSLARGLRRLEGQRGREAASIRSSMCARYAAVLYRQHRAVEAIAWCRRGEHEARRGRARDALADAYLIHDLALLAQGRADAGRYGPRALAIFEELGNLVYQAAVLNNMGLRAYEQGRWSESLALYARAGALWSSTGDTWSASFATYNRGEILSDQGHLDAAEQLLREALRVWRASHAVHNVGYVTRQLGRLMARRGAAADARRLLESAREQQTANGESSEVFLTEAWIAEAAALAGEPAEALEAIAGLERRAGEIDPAGLVAPTLSRIRGWALLQLGRDDEAARAFAAGLGAARTSSGAYELAALLDGAVAAASRCGRPSRRLAGRRDATLARLGIVVAPSAPLALIDRGLRGR